MQKQFGCSGLGWGVAWAASGEHPRVLALWGSTAPRYHVPQLQGFAESMVRCHLESRALPSVEGPGGSGGSEEEVQVGV